MRARNLLAWMGSACAVLAVACSSTSPQQACADYSASLCNKASQCAAGIVDEVYGDTTTCIDRASSQCEQALALNDTGDTPDFVDRCAKAYDAVSCSDAFDNNLPAACKRTTFGKVGDGGACGTDGQCMSGVCQTTLTTGCGICIEPVAVGAACKATSDCQAGLVCAAATSSGAVCVAPAGEGQTCSTTTLPIVPCQSGLLCNGGSCVAPLAAGSACDPSPGKSLCDGASGYYCNSKQTRCVLATFAQPGQPCGLDIGTGNVTACAGGGTTGTGLGTCMNIDKTTLQGTCAAAAADGAACDNTKGPFCLPPALCMNGTCTVVDPSSCQ